MHDLASYDQGAGLRQLAAHSAPRLLCVVHHGDRSAEMTSSMSTAMTLITI